MDTTPEKEIYLYCFARSDCLPTIEGTGLDGHSPLFLWRSLDITAVLGSVSLEEFCGPLAEARMQDLSWLGPRACHHENVIESIMPYSPVLPCRFGTIFSSLESLERLLKNHYHEISQFLDQVADHEEWTVKGFLDSAKARKELFSQRLASQLDHLSYLPPGARYFEEQRILTEAQKEFKQWVREICRELKDDLNQYATDFSERKAVIRDVDRKGWERVCNWEFLIPRSRLADLRARVEGKNGEHFLRGLVFELSGPWPPFSFTPSLCMETVV